MNAPFKMKSSIAKLMKNSPAKQNTNREQKIARNTEFNAYARKTGILPTFKNIEEKEKWYGNKSNVNMLNTKQKEYFKNKK
jgi:hypothetical protein